jgi:transcriptional regulator with XRE-family HTH domain
VTPDNELEQERFILDVTEMICELMNKTGVSKSDLATKLGRTKSHVTQLLSGNRNLTVRTLSDVLVALGYRAIPGALPVAIDYSSYLNTRVIGCLRGEATAPKVDQVEEQFDEEPIAKILPFKRPLIVEWNVNGPVNEIAL